MVHKINDGGQKFAHVGFYVVGAVVKLRNPVGKIGGYYLVEIAGPFEKRPKVEQI